MSWIDITHDEVAGAVGGDTAALERIVAATQDPVYNLALHFLWHPQDAQDSTQEILIRIITNLSSFRSESAYGTWAYRIAVNHLLRAKKSRAERREVSFREAAKVLQVLDEEPLQADETAILNDVKIACSYAMLQGLKRPYRMAFVLGAVVQLSGEDAAAMLGISPEAFRQRLSRSRTAMAEFLGRHCGLVSPSAACRCAKRIKPCIKNHSVEPPVVSSRMRIELYVALAGNLKRSGDFFATEKLLHTDITKLEKVTLLYRSNGSYAVPEALARRIRAVFSTKLFEA